MSLRGLGASSPHARRSAPRCRAGRRGPLGCAQGLASRGLSGDLRCQIPRSWRPCSIAGGRQTLLRSEVPVNPPLAAELGGMARTLGTRANHVPACSTKPASDVIRNGRYGSAGAQRQRRRCRPIGAPAHNFVGPMARLVLEQDESCEACEQRLSPFQGPSVAIHCMTNMNVLVWMQHSRHALSKASTEVLIFEVPLGRLRAPSKPIRGYDHYEAHESVAEVSGHRRSHNPGANGGRCGERRLRSRYSRESGSSVWPWWRDARAGIFGCHGPEAPGALRQPARSG